MISNFLLSLLILLNVILLLVVLFFAKGIRDKASKIGFGIMIFVYMANIIALTGGLFI